MKYLLTVFLFAPYVAAAQKLAAPTPGGGATLEEFIRLLIKIVQSVGIPFLVVALVYSGFVLVTAKDNEAQISKAKIWILWTIVGAAIILSAQVIADVVYGTAKSF